MRTYTVTKREGELLGPVDYHFPFIKHFGNHCCSDLDKKRLCARSISLIRDIENAKKEGTTVYAETYGYFHEVLAVGMYDGWPFWEPTPAILVKGAIGNGWQFYYNIQSMKIEPNPTTTPEEEHE